MTAHLRPACLMILTFTLLFGLAFPLGFVGLGALVMPGPAEGSLVSVAGRPVGSTLIGQDVTGPGFFHTRPSAITGTDPKDPSKTVPTPYDASTSSASNLAPSSKALLDRVRADLPGAGGPGAAVDAVTSSGSGLDPDISPANARRQGGRIAAARHVSGERLEALIAAQTVPRALGLFGEPHLDVLRLNLALQSLR